MYQLIFHPEAEKEFAEAMVCMKENSRVLVSVLCLQLMRSFLKSPLHLKIMVMPANLTGKYQFRYFPIQLYLK